MSTVQAAAVADAQPITAQAAVETQAIETKGTAPSADDEARSDALMLLIVFVSLALVVSFFCSVAETVLLSITPSYIESLKAEHPIRARQLKRLRLDSVDRSLAAILTMNTIAHTVGAIEAGAQSSVLFGSSWVGFFSAVMTLLILFLSEIIPKTLGALYWPRLVGPTQAYIRALICILYPLVRASEWMTRLISRNKDIHSFSREEFLAMAGIGERVGEIDSHESTIIYNLFRFRSLKVTDIMTPRTVVYAYHQDLSIAEAQQLAADSHFSRILLYNKDRDDIVGFVLKDDILMHSIERPTKPNLKLFKRTIEAVPDSMLLPKLLEFLLEKRQQIVIVVDEYGALKGLVTLEDVIETLLGMEIIDEMDTVADMQALARQQWAYRAKALGLQLTDETDPLPLSEQHLQAQSRQRSHDQSQEPQESAADMESTNPAPTGDSDTATRR